MQYRCPEEIASISSQLFYHGAVKCCGKSGKTILLENFMTWCQDMELKKLEQQLRASALSKLQQSSSGGLRINKILDSDDQVCWPYCIPPVCTIFINQTRDQVFNGSRVNQTEAANILKLITHLVDTF